MVSMKDIARRCNVSVASVSKALNGYSDIGEKTKALILNTANEMGYVSGSSTKKVKSKRSYNLGVLFIDQSLHGLTHDYFNHVLESFKNTAEQKGYDVTFITGSTTGHRMSYLEQCKFRGVDGVLVACISSYGDMLHDLIRSELPLVSIDHVYEGKMSVVSGNVHGMEDLVTHIIKKGHRQIAYLHGQDNSVSRQRLTSFYRTMQRYGLDAPDEYAKSCLFRNPDLAAEATSELLRLPDPPTCIIYSDDYAAMGGINVIRERGLRIPHDISVAGYDGIDIAKILEPKLTTIGQDTRRIGEIAALKLIEQIENPKITLNEKITVEGFLIPGASIRQL